MGLVAAGYIVTGVLSIFGWIGIPPIVFTLLGWGQVVGTVSVVTFLFVFNAEFFISFVAQAQGYALSKQHAAKAAKKWGFLVQDGDAEKNGGNKKDRKEK